MFNGEWHTHTKKGEIKPWRIPRQPIMSKEMLGTTFAYQIWAKGMGNNSINSQQWPFKHSCKQETCAFYSAINSVLWHIFTFSHAYFRENWIIAQLWKYPTSYRFPAHITISEHTDLEQKKSKGKKRSWSENHKELAITLVSYSVCRSLRKRADIYY